MLSDQTFGFYVRPLAPDHPFLLAADIDGTLLGDADGEAGLKVLARDYPRSFYLAVISGRARASVQRLIEAQRLPQPHFIGSCVGTELLDCSDPANALGQAYAAQVPAGWDLETVYRLGAGEGIDRQEFVDGQPRFQAGFFWDGRPQTLAAFCHRLAPVPGIQILPSSDQYIDVFPKQVGKGALVQFLQEALALDPRQVMVAGDTGNDCGMFETGFKGVVPVNALDELREVARHPWHYQSALPAARGILDGLCHFGFVERA